LLNSSSETDGALVNACGVLRSICVTQDHARAVALASNAIPPLVRLLSHINAQVHEQAAMALWNITVLDEARMASLEAGAIPPLVEMLNSSYPGVQSAAC